jgi:hypothetical protein
MISDRRGAEETWISQKDFVICKLETFHLAFWKTKLLPT